MFMGTNCKKKKTRKFVRLLARMGGTFPCTDWGDTWNLSTCTGKKTDAGVSVITNATVEELLEAVLSVWSALRLYSEE
jgi:hypothetical protein